MLSTEKIKSHFESTKLRHSLLINGYVRHIDTTDIPMDVILICNRFSYIDIKDHILSNKESLTKIPPLLTTAAREHNYLLGMELGLFCLDHPEFIVFEWTFYANLAVCYQGMRLYNKAEHNFKIAIEKQQFCAFRYAAFLTEQNRYSEALSCVDSVLTKHADKQIPTALKIVFLFQKARNLELLNRNIEASESYAKIIMEYEIPGNASKIDQFCVNTVKGQNVTYMAVASAYRKCGKMKQSEQLYEKCKFELSNVSQVHFKYGCGELKFFWIFEKHDKAWKYIIKAIKSNNDHPFIWYYYGVLLRDKRKYDEAIDAFDKSIQSLELEQYKFCKIPCYQDRQSLCDK